MPIPCLPRKHGQARNKALELPMIKRLSAASTLLKTLLSMFVAPSAVYFTTCPDVPNLECLTSDAELEELSKKILINSEGLRLQVVEKDGHYFTLNNTRLQVCQWLETRGQCNTVRIETVPLKSVPDGIKRMMVVPPPVVYPQDEFDERDQQSRRRRQSEESGEEEDTSLLNETEGDIRMDTSKQLMPTNTYFLK
ncbi:uncharacterized protein LOC106068207 isoform X9 [Biomphalaria glabrata]|uniref:Uncharacterized protein LOC106068207 isoform X9 n=1 Tax=Biomphalaria glabrata TaxID=6526 RepID=A0A9W2ZL70_BIOGL|nr:uncharacterized protein LOC106068207 isoform X9 [Biomphalaria glabrata]